MASDEDIIVSCTNADCLLRLRTTPVDLAPVMDLYPGRSIPTHVEALATHAAVPCPACENEGRDGTLVYISNWVSEDVSVLDARSHDLVRRVKVGAIMDRPVWGALISMRCSNRMSRAYSDHAPNAPEG